MAGEPRTTALNPEWSERYLDGSPEREAELFRVFAEQIQQVQERNRWGEDLPIRRAFHAKLLAGIANARFVVADDVRPELRSDLFVPGAAYPAVVRLSNASGILRKDSARDLRGIAIRVTLPGGEVQDLLLSNTPASHARDARQFMAAAVAMAGGRRFTALPRLMRRLGFREAMRLFRSLRLSASRRVASLAAESFWSRAPFAVGPYAVKFKLEPLAPTPGRALAREPDSLRNELVERLRDEDVRYRLRVLHFVDEQTTPIEDASVRWPEGDEPPEIVAELVLPRQDLAAAEGPEAERMVEGLAFDPSNAAGGIRPIGGLNRARRPVYAASARLRSRGS